SAHAAGGARRASRDLALDALAGVRLARAPRRPAARAAPHVQLRHRHGRRRRRAGRGRRAPLPDRGRRGGPGDRRGRRRRGRPGRDSLSASELPAVVVLISGEGTNLQALIDAARDRRLPARIAAAISDRRDARGLERARRAGIEAVHLGPRGFEDREAYERALADAIAAFSPAAVV